MKPVRVVTLIFSLILFVAAKSFPQDGINSRMSANIPSRFENQSASTVNDPEPDLSELELLHKKALENGDNMAAEKFESQIFSMTAEQKKFLISKNSADIISNIKHPQTQNDWMSANSLVYGGDTKSMQSLHKQVDMKLGEDNVLYAAVNTPGIGAVHAYLYFYKSTNFGLNWSYVYSFGTGNYVGNISLLIESKNNSVADSVRMILFYTGSFSSDNSNATLEYYSVRVDGGGSKSGTIAAPAAGKTFTQICSVSDGAYWQSATYFGAVCAETDFATGDTYRLRFFRTIDWGSNWTGASINTGFNDLYPTADYKEGSADSVYIAVQRKFSATNSEIRVIATPWNPSSNYSTYYITNSTLKYEKPCITIKQSPSADSILVTCTRNGMPLYHFTPNAGGAWYIDYFISSSNGSNKIFTNCSSSKTGATPFSVCWVNGTGDSINTRRGILGNLGNTVYDVNDNYSFSYTSPVCVSLSLPNTNLTSILYAAYPTGVYSTQEGSKSINIKIIPQGFYNPASNLLNMRDTIRIYLRETTFPFAIVDSGKSVFDSAGSFNAAFQFSMLHDGSYYISIRHRNFLETWSLPVSLIITSNNDYNFTIAASTAYGNNLVQVDNSPVRFAAYSGDINQDGTIDLTDLVNIYNDANNFLSGYLKTDITGDNYVDLSDLTFTFNNSQNFVSIIRP